MLANLLYLPPYINNIKYLCVSNKVRMRFPNFAFLVQFVVYSFIIIRSMVQAPLLFIERKKTIVGVLF